jgi:hypothetical protein
MILSQDVAQGKTTADRIADEAVARDDATRRGGAGAADRPLAHDQLMHFGGFDWASDHHDVVVVDRAGKIVRSFRFDDTAEGWQSFRETMARFSRSASWSKRGPAPSSSGCSTRA